MNEKPKSIWKKSWAGGRGLFFGWLILMAALAAIFLIWTVAEGTPLNQSGDELKLFVVAGIGVTVIFLLVISVRWACCRRNFKRFLFGLACSATLIALFYAEEDWRGKHDWEKFKREWKAKGERFDWQSIVPPPVPDDQNFAFSPVWIGEVKFNFQSNPKRAEAWYGDRIYSEEVSKIFQLLPVSESGLVGTNWYSKSHLPNEPAGPGNWAAARLPDLKPWQAYYRELEKTYPAAGIPIAPQPQSPAQDVLLALSKFDPVIEQLRQDSAWPYSRFPIGYGDEDKAMILLPHLGAVKQYSLVLRLRASAELQNGETEKAFDDVKLSLRLIDSIRSEPFLISHLVRIAMLQITLQPIYEGLAEHKWSDAQLAELDSELAKLDFLADYKMSMRGEMGLQGGNINYLIHHRRELSDIGFESGGSPPPPFVSALIPTGWFYQNQMNCARMMVEFYIPLADVNQQTVSPVADRHTDDALRVETKKTTPYNILEKMLFPAFGNAVKKFAYAQSSVDLARVAIALERYRLAHGDYPDSLDALAPQFIEKIPHDVIGGQPLHYRLTDDGQFVLYSVGWNERDDGGVVVTKPVGMNSNRTPIWDISQGDWVWRYPAK